MCTPPSQWIKPYRKTEPMPAQQLPKTEKSRTPRLAIVSQLACRQVVGRDGREPMGFRGDETISSVQEGILEPEKTKLKQNHSKKAVERREEQNEPANDAITAKKTEGLSNLHSKLGLVWSGHWIVRMRERNCESEARARPRIGLYLFLSSTKGLRRKNHLAQAPWSLV